MITSKRELSSYKIDEKIPPKTKQQHREPPNDYDIEVKNQETGVRRGRRIRRKSTPSVDFGPRQVKRENHAKINTCSLYKGAALIKVLVRGSKDP